MASAICGSTRRTARETVASCRFISEAISSALIRSSSYPAFAARLAFVGFVASNCNDSVLLRLGLAIECGSFRRQLALWKHAGSVSDSESRQAPERHIRSEEHTSELQSRRDLVCRLLLEKKKKIIKTKNNKKKKIK